MNYYHAAVWLDHNKARIFHVGAEDYEEVTINSPQAHTQLHRRSGPGAESGHRAAEDQRYYHDVARALAGAEAILVLGPSTAKHELKKHIQQHDPKLDAKIVGVEPMDHPSDRQLVAHVRGYFRARDEMRG